MRVAMYYNNQDLRLEEIPEPKIQEDELLVKVVACGICGSDVMEWYRVKRAPLVLGHEATGEIVKIGKSVTRYKIGDRVFVSHHVPCNKCRYCLSGNHTVCETLHTTNYYPGGFSEYIRVPSVNVERGVFLLPQGISYEQGTFIEPLACVIRGQRMAGLKTGQSALIFGCGISGLLHILLASLNNADKIVAVDINEYRLKLAKELGATSVIKTGDDVVTQLRKVNEGRLADQVIICTNAFPAFTQALECVDRAGTVLCFAPTDPGVNLPVPVNDFWRKSVRILHSYGASPSDLKEAIEVMRTKSLPLDKLITHRLSLEDIGLGFKLVSEANECLKVIISPQES